MGRGGGRGGLMGPGRRPLIRFLSSLVMTVHQTLQVEVEYSKYVLTDFRFRVSRYTSPVSDLSRPPKRRGDPCAL